MRLARPGNAALSALGVLIGAASAASPDGLPTAPVWWAMLSALAGTAGGNVLNDLMDRDVDRHAHPDRALVTGAVTARGATAFVLVAWVVALGSAALASAAVLFVAATLIGILVAYEVALKSAGLPGNLAVAVVAGALFPFGAIAATGGFVGATGLPLVIGGIAGLAHLGRELQKDAEDAAGDAAYRRTFAVRHGARAAAGLGAVLLLGAVALSPVPHLVHGWGNGYLAVVIAADALFVAAAWQGILRPQRGRAASKLGMIVALAAFAVGAWWP